MARDQWPGTLGTGSFLHKYGQMLPRAVHSRGNRTLGLPRQLPSFFVVVLVMLVKLVVAVVVVAVLAAWSFVLLGD